MSEPLDFTGRWWTKGFKLITVTRYDKTTFRGIEDNTFEQFIYDGNGIVISSPTGNIKEDLHSYDLVQRVNPQSAEAEMPKPIKGFYGKTVRSKAGYSTDDVIAISIIAGFLANKADYTYDEKDVALDAKALFDAVIEVTRDVS